MERNTYVAIKEELVRRGVFRASSAHGMLTLATEGLVLGTLLFLLAQSSGYGWAYLGLEVLLASSMFRAFVILHECGHRSLLASKFWNDVWGHVSSIFSLLPYLAWRDIHNLHHRWVGVVDKDPTQAHLLNLRNASAAEVWLMRLIWKLWIPVGFIKFFFQVFWGKPFRDLASGHRRAGRLGFASLLAVVLPHSIAMAALGPIAYLRIWLPAACLYFAIYELVNLPQHSGLFPHTSLTRSSPIPYGEQMSITRTTHLPAALAVALVYNFTLHVEHHLFPTVPWYHLPKVKRLVVGSLAAHEYVAVPFFAFMRDLRRQDPVKIYVDSLPRMVP